MLTVLEKSFTLIWILLWECSYKLHRPQRPDAERESLRGITIFQNNNIINLYYKTLLYLTKLQSLVNRKLNFLPLTTTNCHRPPRGHNVVKPFLKRQHYVNITPILTTLLCYQWLTRQQKLASPGLPVSPPLYCRSGKVASLVWH